MKINLKEIYSNYQETAIAMEDIELVEIPKEDFELLINKNREVSRKFIQLLTKNISEKEEQLIGMAYNSLRKKVANALIILNRKYNSGNDQKVKIDITRDSLASIAGTATELLIRTLGDFKNENLISVHEGAITTVNVKKLENLIN